MTSDVKSREQLFYVRIMFFPLLYRKSRSQEDTTVDHADIRGLATTLLASVGCLPQSRDERGVIAPFPRGYAACCSHRTPLAISA
jgi:hypothetical protein